MIIVKRLSLLFVTGAVLVPAASSQASQFVHGSICRPSGDNGNPQAYTAHPGGFETSANMDITCAAPVDNVTVANPIWRINVQKSTATTMNCTGSILNSSGETVATSSASTSGTGEQLIGATFTAAQSNLYSYGFRCVNAPPVLVENIRVF